jgi:hypothetical protein
VKPAEPATPESSSVEPKDTAAAAGASVEPPSSGNGAVPPSSTAETAPPPPLDTTGAGTVTNKVEETESIPAKKSSPVGIVLLVGALAAGIGLIVRMTMRRRRDEDLSIFDRTTGPAAPRPPIAHHL